MENLDIIDKKILNALQRGDLTVPKITEIAKILDLPPATVHTRVKKLQENKIIEGYPAIVNSNKVGKDLTIFLILKVVYSKHYSGSQPIKDFAKNLAKIPEVLEIHNCSGDWDYFIKLKVKDTEDYHRIITYEVLPLGGIEKAESVVVYQTLKETRSLIV